VVYKALSSIRYNIYIYFTVIILKKYPYTNYILSFKAFRFSVELLYAHSVSLQWISDLIASPVTPLLHS